MQTDFNDYYFCSQNKVFNLKKTDERSKRVTEEGKDWD